MKVLVDAYNIALPKGTGVATYGRNFLKSLIRQDIGTGLLFGQGIGPGGPPMRDAAVLRSSIGHQSKIGRKSELFFGALRALWPHHAFPVPFGPDSNPLQSIPPEAQELWNAKWLYRRSIGAFNKMRRWSSVEGPSCDVMHWTYPVPICMPDAKNIYTLHDLVPLLRPELSLEDRSVYYSLCKGCIERSDLILTISEQSKADIVKVFGCDPEKIVNTYQSHDINAATAAQADADFDALVPELLSLDRQGYFLFFGAIEPKKNVGRLIEGYLAASVEKPLVIVGVPAWQSEEQLALLDPYRRLGRGRKILYVEYLPRHILLALVRNAYAMIFPSLYEGFGLPVLEAMALGTPVITSNISSLPEVAGEAALLLNPLEVREIVQAIELYERDIALRNHMAAAGQVRAQLFSTDHYDHRVAQALVRLSDINRAASVS